MRRTALALVAICLAAPAGAQAYVPEPYGEQPYPRTGTATRSPEVQPKYPPPASCQRCTV